MWQKVRNAVRCDRTDKVPLAEEQTSMAAFHSKLKGSSLSWYDPGHNDSVTRFLLTVTFLPQILIAAVRKVQENFLSLEVSMTASTHT